MLFLCFSTSHFACSTPLLVPTLDGCWRGGRAQLVDYEREVELKFGRALGGVPPSEAEVQDVEVARHYADTKQEATSKLSNQRRYHPELGPGRGAHFAGVDPIPGASPPVTPPAPSWEGAGARSSVTRSFVP